MDNCLGFHQQRKHLRKYRCRSRQLFGGAKDFCPNFPKLAWKVFCETFTYKVAPIKIVKTFFWWDFQIKVFMCLFANVGRHFVKSNNVGCHICPDFQEFCSDFRQIKHFGGALAPSTSPPGTPLCGRFRCSEKVEKHCCRGRLRNLQKDCSTIGLYWVTITWQQIFI